MTLASTAQIWRKRLTQGMVKDSAIYVAGELLSKAVPFVLLPYLTRQLGVAGFGALAFYTAVSAFLLIFISLSQNAAITRYYYVYGKHGLGNVVLAGALLSVGLWAVVACGLVVTGALLGNQLSLNTQLLGYSTLLALGQSLVQSQLAVRQCQKRAWDYLALQLLLATTNVGLTVMFFSAMTADRVATGADGQVAARLLAIVLAQAITACLAWLLMRTRLGIRLSWRKRRLWLAMRYIVALGLPLVLHALSYTLKGQLDRVWVYQRFSAAELGVYAAGVQLAGAVSVVIMAVNSAAVPYLYEAFKARRMPIVRLHRWGLMSLLLAPIAAGVVWLLPRSLFGWLLGAAFADSQYYVACFTAAFMLLIPYLLWVNVLFYHGKNRQIAAASMLSTLVYVAVLAYTSSLALTWVPLATLASNAVLLPLLYHLTKRIEPV